MKKIVIAPQAFKGTLSAWKAAEAMAAGALRVFPHAQMDLVPIADGGDGTLDVLVRVGLRFKTEALNAIGTKIEVEWGVLPDGKTAVIEMAKVCGLSLISPEKRNPLVATTYGLGQVIRAALDRGFRRFIIGLGGSATHDGGAGMMQALGARLIDGEEMEKARGAAPLLDLTQIDLSGLDPRLAACKFNVACDVSNPLLGPTGAAYIYAPQKGATDDMLPLLEEAMERWADVIEADIGVDVRQILHGGAAGGTATALFAFLKAHLETGAEMILEKLQFYEHLRDADLVLVGEGRLDRQTCFEKAPIVAAKHAKAFDLPVIAIVGSLGDGYEKTLLQGIDTAIPISSTQQSAASALTQTTEQALRGLSVF